MASSSTKDDQMLTEAERRFVEAEKARTEEEEKMIESMATRLLSDLAREIERTGKRKIQFTWEESSRNESCGKNVPLRVVHGILRRIRVKAPSVETRTTVDQDGNDADVTDEYQMVRGPIFYLEWKPHVQ